jgi:hypothetical protein
VGDMSVNQLLSQSQASQPVTRQPYSWLFCNPVISHEVSSPLVGQSFRQLLSSLHSSLYQPECLKITSPWHKIKLSQTELSDVIQGHSAALGPANSCLWDNSSKWDNLDGHYHPAYQKGPPT